MTELRYQIRRRFNRDRIAMAIVWRLPKWLVYWSTIRIWANATTGQYGNTEAPAVRVDEALKRWEKP